MDQGISTSARQLLARLQRLGPATRGDMARLMAVQPSTVTRLVADLIERGLIVEEPDPRREGKRGFPTKMLVLQPGRLKTCGVFIDPDRIFTCVLDGLGETLAEESLPLRDRGFEPVIARARASLEAQLSGLGVARDAVIGCGFSYPGQQTEVPGKILKTRYFSDWPTLDNRHDLSPLFGMPVRHMNDAKAACLAEVLYGGCRELQTVCQFWLSYGIGGAAVIGRQLYLGANGAAAEFGGFFPKSRPRPSGQDLLDTLAAAGQRFERLEDLDPQVLAGDVAQRWLDRAAGELRWASLIVARTFAPEAIVIGGRLAPVLLDGIVARLQAAPLGEDFFIAPPRFLRATMDGTPHKGAAAVPLYDWLDAASG